MTERRYKPSEHERKRKHHSTHDDSEGGIDYTFISIPDTTPDFGNDSGYDGGSSDGGFDGGGGDFGGGGDSGSW